MIVLPNMDVVTEAQLVQASELLVQRGILPEGFRGCELPLLLEDAFPLSDKYLGEARSLLEATGTQPRLQGIFQRAESKNANGRIYPLQLLEREVVRLQPLLKERRLLGELDHPQSAKIRVPFASHVVTKLWMEGNDVWGELEPLTTDCGNNLRSLVHDRVKFGVSSRGTGNLKTEDRGLIVQENYRMLTYDIVSDPSTQGAFPTEMTESNGNCIGCGNCDGDHANHTHHKEPLREDTIDTPEEAAKLLRIWAERL